MIISNLLIIIKQVKEYKDPLILQQVPSFQANRFSVTCLLCVLHVLYVLNTINIWYHRNVCLRKTT